MTPDQVHLAEIIEQNIHTIFNTRRITANQQTTEERPFQDSHQLFGACILIH
jgi:predicted component of type VI protein secretion system